MQQQIMRTESSDLAAPPAQTHHLRSCVTCRTRKIKCDRQQPCCNCIKAGHDDATCVYPPGPGRAPKRSRQKTDSRLVDRLSQLESLIEQFQRQQQPSPYTPPARHIDASPTPSTTDTSSPNSNAIDQQMGRLVIDETRSYYVSNVLWASLSSEIEELRNMLTEPASEDEDEDFGMPDSNAALLGYRVLAHSLKSYHPSLRQSVELLRIFTENVVPILHMFHMPTTTEVFWSAIASLDSIDRNTEALLFAIYYSAVTSLDEDSEQCEAVLGVSRKAALEKYRFATEQSMARAKLLNTQSIILLQAAVLFLAALNNGDDTRTAWSLTALVYHIAQAMGLHRDGTAFGLRPLETEMRRRLWYHICMLDHRTSEYHGFEPIVHENSFDTRVPLHVNDADLTASMVAPPPERSEACDMTFCRIRCELMRTSRKINNVPHWVQGQPKDGLSLAERQALVTDLTSRLEEVYLRYCEGSSIRFMRVASMSTRMVLARMWLTVNHPRENPSAPTGSGATGMRDQLFLTSIEVLELSAQILTDPDLGPWRWQCGTHIQWHAVAFVLSEICARPPGPDCDRAWGHVCVVHEAWRLKESGRNGTLWRPIQRLMAKARYVREIQRTEHGRRRVAIPDVPAGLVVRNGATLILSPDSSHANHTDAANGTPSGVDISEVQDNSMNLEPLDPYVQLLPDDWQKDLFDDAIQGSHREFDPDVLDSWFA